MWSCQDKRLLGDFGFHVGLVATSLSGVASCPLGHSYCISTKCSDGHRWEVMVKAPVDDSWLGFLPPPPAVTRCSDGNNLKEKRLSMLYFQHCSIMSGKPRQPGLVQLGTWIHSQEERVTMTGMGDGAHLKFSMVHDQHAPSTWTHPQWRWLFPQQLM